MLLIPDQVGLRRLLNVLSLKTRFEAGDITEEKYIEGLNALTFGDGEVGAGVVLKKRAPSNNGILNLKTYCNMWKKQKKKLKTWYTCSKVSLLVDKIKQNQVICVIRILPK